MSPDWQPRDCMPCYCLRSRPPKSPAAATGTAQQARCRDFGLPWGAPPPRRPRRLRRLRCPRCPARPLRKACPSRPRPGSRPPSRRRGSRPRARPSPTSQPVRWRRGLLGPFGRLWLDRRGRRKPGRASKRLCKAPLESTTSVHCMRGSSPCSSTRAERDWLTSRERWCCRFVSIAKATFATAGSARVRAPGLSIARRCESQSEPRLSGRSLFTFGTPTWPSSSPWSLLSATDRRVPSLRKLDFQPDIFFVAEQNDCSVGARMAGYAGHRGWLERSDGVSLAPAPGDRPRIRRGPERAGREKCRECSPSPS